MPSGLSLGGNQGFGYTWERVNRTAAFCCFRVLLLLSAENFLVGSQGERILVSDIEGKEIVTYNQSKS